MLRPTHYPLGLTRGSVRAILAILITIATIAALLDSLSRGELPAAAAALVLLDQKVIGDYFAARAGDSNGGG